MKKIVVVLMVVLLGWLAKLNYDVWQIAQKVPELETALQSIEQRNASLNDQLVALKRQSQQVAAISAPETAARPATEVMILNPTLLIKQQLNLAQFALEQLQFNYAIAQLQQLDQKLAGYALSVALEQSLHQVLLKDEQAIEQFMRARADQQQNIQVVLNQLDALLGQELRAVNMSTPAASAGFWKTWLKIETTQTLPPDLMTRKLQLKEVQLRLLIAQQALLHGQQAEYQQALIQAIQQLNQLPDAQAQTLKGRLEKLKSLEMVPTPKLSAWALVN